MSTPNVVGYCRTCDTPLVSGHTPAGQVPDGHRRHDGQHLCNACAARQRRANQAAAQTAHLNNPAPDWAASAACAGTDPEIWYGDTGAYPDVLNRICGSCPVRIECLTAALIEEAGASTHNRFGYRAGTSPSERWQLWKDREAVA